MIKSRSILDVCCSMVQRYEKYFFMYHICTIFSAKHASGSHGSFHLRQFIPYKSIKNIKNLESSNNILNFAAENDKCEGVGYVYMYN